MGGSMRATLDRRELVAALKTVSPAAAKTTQLPVLTGVRIDVAATGVDLVCTSLDMTIGTTIDAPHSTKGTAIVPAGLLLRVVSAMTGETAIIEVDTDRLVVTCGEGHASLRTMDVTMWPALPEPDGQSCAVDNLTVALMAKIAPMASRDTTRPILTGMYVADGRAACTDSYRLGVVEGLDPDLGPALIPVAGLAAMFAAGCEVHVRCDARLASFAAGPTTWTVRLIDNNGAYPDYMRLVGDPPETLTVDRDALLAAANLAGVLVSDEVTKGVQLTRDGDKVVVGAGQVEVGDTTDTIPVSGTYEGAVAFNRAFLSDLLACCEPGEVTIRLTDASKAAEVRSGRLTAVLMPVRTG